MDGVETWANLNRLVIWVDGPKREPTREEWLRQERVAVGRICMCEDCLCCEELVREVKGSVLTNTEVRA